MRIFNSIPEAYEEVGRELFEMGFRYQSATYQDKKVADDEGFVTCELHSYSFSITNPNSAEGTGLIIATYGDEAGEWLWEEHTERVGGVGKNPGNAWVFREEVWTPFLEADGRFSYTYSERIAPQLERTISELCIRPATRQAIIEIHNNQIDLQNMGGKRRIPCSMFYQFTIRQRGLNLTYVMRSSDYLTHFLYDVTLAVKLQEHIAAKTGQTVGDFSMFVVSLHAFQKDMEKIGIF